MTSGDINIHNLYSVLKRYDFHTSYLAKCIIIIVLYQLDDDDDGDNPVVLYYFHRFSEPMIDIFAARLVLGWGWGSSYNACVTGHVSCWVSERAGGRTGMSGCRILCTCGKVEREGGLGGWCVVVRTACNVLVRHDRRGKHSDQPDSKYNCSPRRGETMGWWCPHPNLLRCSIFWLLVGKFGCHEHSSYSRLYVSYS